jgi:hypothetical protein
MRCSLLIGKAVQQAAVCSMCTSSALCYGPGWEWRETRQVQLCVHAMHDGVINIASPLRNYFALQLILT